MKLLTILLTSILLASCSNKYGSKIEATAAANEWRDKGKQVTVVNKLSEGEIDRLVTIRKEDCQREEQTIKRNLAAGWQGSIETGFNSHAQAFIDQLCSPEAISAIGIDDENREQIRTRDCEYEEVTSQWVCNERWVKAKSIDRDEFEKIKATYTYFRF